MTPNSFENVPDRLQAGTESVAQEVFTRFTTRLVALARSRLDTRVRSRVDPDDVVQSVYRSFFNRQREQPFELKDWDGMWALLARITVRKCGRQAAAHKAAKRDVRRDLKQASNNDQSMPKLELAAAEPTAEQVVYFEELLSEIFRGLTAEKREMLVLRLQGHSIEEISQAVERTERSVYRLFNSLRQQLSKLEESSTPAK